MSQKSLKQRSMKQMHQKNKHMFPLQYLQLFVFFSFKKGNERGHYNILQTLKKIIQHSYSKRYRRVKQSTGNCWETY